MRHLLHILLAILIGSSSSCSDNKATPTRLQPQRLSPAADTIRRSLRHATRFIDSARHLLVARDSAGDNEQVAAMVLVHTPLGDSIRSAVLAFIDRCHNSWPNPATIVNIDNSFHYTKQVLAPEAWPRQNFSDTPTASAYTLLSSMEDECTRAADLAISRIDGVAP
jgi:hypothetical protein